MNILLPIVKKEHSQNVNFGCALFSLHKQKKMLSSLHKQNVNFLLYTFKLNIQNFIESVTLINLKKIIFRIMEMKRKFLENQAGGRVLRNSGSEALFL